MAVAWAACSSAVEVASVRRDGSLGYWAVESVEYWAGLRVKTAVVGPSDSLAVKAVEREVALVEGR